MKKIILLLSLLLIVGCAGEPQVTDTEFYNAVTGSNYMQIMCGDQDFKDCIDVEYPWIRIQNSEDYGIAGQELLVRTVGKEITEQLPQLYDKTISFSFRDRNQKTLAIISWHKGKGTRVK